MQSCVLFGTPGRCYKKFPIQEDQTEPKFLLINLEQVFDQNHFKCEFYKKILLIKVD